MIGGVRAQDVLAGGERDRFETALGARVLDEMALYAAEAKGIGAAT